MASKRPELVRSESENLEYSTLTRTHRTVSLSNLLNAAAEAGQISSQRSFTKLTDPLNASEARDTVIFIKSCCMNHENNVNRINTEEIRNEKTEIISESQLKDLSKLITEEKYSSTKIHSSSEIVAQTENCVSHKKRQRTKKKHHASKQRKVGTICCT